MTASVVVADLSKFYGKCVALRHVSFTAAPGSIYGLVGPNGAGKTTSLSIMAGLVSPTSGRVTILGIEVEPNRGELVKKLGFASPKYSFFDYLTGAEVLRTCGIMHGLKNQEARRRARDLMELLDLDGAGDHFLYQYSHGMRQKLGLACAMVHAPEVLLLDEPFMGLDPTSVYRVAHTLQQMAACGSTVVLTSHNLALVERLCDRAGILHEGVLKRELDIVHEAGGGTATREPELGLEAALWEVIGTPELKALDWIRNSGGDHGPLQ